MNRPRIRLALAAFALIVLASVLQPSMASGLRAKVSSTRIGFGESFQLVLSVDASRMTAAPDLTPLEDHFQILGTGRSSQTNIINGKRTDTASWVITLTSNEKGTLTIPAITVGSDSSQPMTIEVVAARASSAGSAGAADFSIDVTVEPGTHYVQEEIPVRVRIQGGAGLRQASLQEPSGSDFVLTRSGDDQISHGTRNGRDITIIERRYFLKPQKSGSLTIPPLVLQATLEDPTARTSIFSDMGFAGSMMGSPFGSSLLADMFSPGRTVRLRSEPLKLEVQPRPTGDSVWFLPAKRVELQANWASNHPVFRVGEAVTREIRLFALGASREQLPDIPLGTSDGARFYVDRSRDDSADTPEGTAAIRELDVSVVPTRAGQVSLPAIEVRWWDTTADRERVATLASQQITVAAGANPGGASTLSAAPAAQIPPAPRAAPAPAQNAGSSMNRLVAYGGPIGLLIITLLAGALLMVKRRRKRSPPKYALGANRAHRAGGENRHDSELDQHERSFVRACKANDLRAAYAALRAWLVSDSTRAGGVSPELASELAAMERKLYAHADGTPWRAKHALELFIKEKRARRAAARRRSSRNALPALYPA